MIELSLRGAKVKATPKQIARMASAFKENHLILLKGLLPKNLFSRALKGMPPRAFTKMVHKDISVELCMRSNTTFALLRFLMNDYALFDVINKISGCGPIGCFNARVYRMLPGTHYDSWHDDWAHTRMIALSLNLSEKKFHGGELSLRRKDKPNKVLSIANTGPGDAILFRLGKNLEHRVGKIEGEFPKTAFAGWFQSKPDYLNSIRKLKSGKVANC